MSEPSSAASVPDPHRQGRSAAILLGELLVRALLLAGCALLIAGALAGFGVEAVPPQLWLALAAGLWVVSTLGLLSRRQDAERRIRARSWSALTREQKLKRWAFTLWITPLALFPFWLLAVAEPSLLLEDWEVWLLLYGLPWAAGTALYLLARRPSIGSARR